MRRAVQAFPGGAGAVVEWLGPFVLALTLADVGEIVKVGDVALVLAPEVDRLQRFLERLLRLGVVAAIEQPHAVGEVAVPEGAAHRQRFFTQRAPPAKWGTGKL